LNIKREIRYFTNKTEPIEQKLKSLSLRFPDIKDSQLFVLFGSLVSELLLFSVSALNNSSQKYFLLFVTMLKAHADPLLGGDGDIGECTAVVARQRPANNRVIMFSALSGKQQLETTEEQCFYAVRIEML
jgi:hypothetical protein